MAASGRNLNQINSGEFAESRIGNFLNDLRDNFAGPVVVDMFCYLRLYTELALRAKGVLMMRPFLLMTRKDLWQLYVLEGHD